MPNPTTVIVTGANRGIGQAICNLILARKELSPIKLYATSRKGEDLGFETNSPEDKVIYPKLDIADSKSIKALADGIKQEGAVDVLINNAGINNDNEYSPENARKELDVNYRGTLEMCQTFIPLLSKEGRIVNLSSTGSTLKNYSETIQSRFRDPKMSLNALEFLAEQFIASVDSSTESSVGFGGPGKAYSFSKACVDAFTRILAQENEGLVINCCCPGWVDTDMGNIVGDAPKRPEDGAKIPVKLAFGDIGNVTGRYWANDSIRSTEDGKVQEW